MPWFGRLLDFCKEQIDLLKNAFDKEVRIELAVMFKTEKYYKNAEGEHFGINLLLKSQWPSI